MSDPRETLEDHIGAMRAFAISLTRDPILADDLVQEALMKAWSHMDGYQEGSNMRAWLFTILRNTYYSLHRKRRREVQDVDGVFQQTLSQKPDHDGRLNLRDFNAAFAQLPDEQREALVLVGAGGFSYEEAAKTCGVKVGTIKSRVSRGRLRLAELMQLPENEPIELTDVVTAGIVTGRNLS
ncbi:RNA polymerase sigma factor [Phaeobacter sp.]|uniref:RNA polymerase sigma factor n=1 Tax=Phaeobacter sp. TaxID=1902409 RepID=UPI0025F99445|nr:RNA polymerase sigma factor [Phaeobacter sp.]